MLKTLNRSSPKFASMIKSQMSPQCKSLSRSVQVFFLSQENHMINWSKAMVIDMEPVRFSRIIIIVIIIIIIIIIIIKIFIEVDNCNQTNKKG